MEIDGWIDRWIDKLIDILIDRKIDIRLITMSILLHIQVYKRMLECKNLKILPQLKPCLVSR